MVFIVQFFRDPPRVVPSQPNAVLSPADGRVMVVEKARDPYLDRDALKISVFMNVFNVHSNRSPVDGIVRNKWYHAGSFLNAALAKSSLENERNALHIATANGVDVTCVQIAGLIARRILCYVEAGRHACARSALWLHPFWLARRHLSAANRHAESRGRRHGESDVDDHCRNRIALCRARHCVALPALLG